MQVAIRKFRQARHLTQAELAARIGKTVGSISLYERGRVNIPAQVLYQIAVVLGVSVGDLLEPNGDAVASHNSEHPGRI
jgi:transcriptional regulator with XRE-family HTH domain